MRHTSWRWIGRPHLSIRRKIRLDRLARLSHSILERASSGATRLKMGQATLQGSGRENLQSPFVGTEADEARILVVEDDDAMRAFLDESLREEGYVVRTASNTLSGIVTLLGEPIDVLVVDWKMPDLDGFALLS